MNLPKSNLSENDNILSEEFVSNKLLSVEGLNKVYEVTVKYDGFAEMIKSFLMDQKKTYSDNHFRAGKAPLSLVKQKFFNFAVQEVSKKVIDQFVSSIKEDYIGTPDISIKQFYAEDSKNLDPIFEIKLTLKPTVPNVDLAKCKITDPNVSVSDEDINKEMELWAKSHERPVELSKARESKMGDTLNVSMSLLDKSEEAQSFDVKLGSGTFVKEIEAKLVGQNEGTQINHTIDIPKNISKNPGLPSDVKQFAGKKLGVNLKINKIMETKNYEVDLDMAKHFGCSSLESCKMKFKTMLEEKIVESKFIHKKHQLESYLNKSVDVEIPQSLIDKEKLIMWHGLLHKFQITRKEMFSIEEIKTILGQIQNIGFLTKHTFEDIEKEYEKLAKRRISFFFIIQKFQTDMNVSLTQAEIDTEKVKKAADLKGGPMEAFKYYEKNKQELAKLENILLENKIVNEVLVKCTISASDMSITELSKSLEKMVKELEPNIDFSPAKKDKQTDETKNNVDEKKASSTKKTTKSSGSDEEKKPAKKAVAKKASEAKKTKKTVEQDS